MKEVLENIWNWIDVYSWTLVAIVLIILGIIGIVCVISLTISQKKVDKKKIEDIEQETKLFRDKKGRFTKRK